MYVSKEYLYTSRNIGSLSMIIIFRIFEFITIIGKFKIAHILGANSAFFQGYSSFLYAIL